MASFLRGNQDVGVNPFAGGVNRSMRQAPMKRTSQSNVDAGSLNTALNPTSAPAGSIPYKSFSIPQRSAGMDGAGPSGARAQLMTGFGPQAGLGYGVPRAQGLGGMSNQAIQAYLRYAPNSAVSRSIMMPGTQPGFFNEEAGEAGIPRFAGFGPNIATGVRGIAPGSEQNGVMWTGFPVNTNRLQTVNPTLADLSATNSQRSNMGQQASISPFMSDVFTQPRVREPETTTMNKETNVTIPWAHLTRTIGKQLGQHDHHGLIIMLYKGPSDDKCAMPDILEDAVGPNGIAPDTKRRMTMPQRVMRYTEVSLQLFNYFLALEVNNPGAGRRHKTAEEILRDWCVHGVANTFQGGDDPAAMLPYSSMQGNVHTSERIINTVVAGQAAACNIWDAQRCQERLYLVLKRISREKIKNEWTTQLVTGNYRAPMRDSDVSNLLFYRVQPNSPAVPLPDSELHPAPYQLVPYTTDKWHGLSYELAESAGGADSAVIQVGRVLYPQTTGNVMVPGKQGATDINVARTCGTIQMIVDIQLDLYLHEGVERQEERVTFEEERGSERGGITEESEELRKLRQAVYDANLELIGAYRKNPTAEETAAIDRARAKRNAAEKAFTDAGGRIELSGGGGGNGNGDGDGDGGEF